MAPVMGRAGAELLAAVALAMLAGCGAKATFGAKRDVGGSEVAVRSIRTSPIELVTLVAPFDPQERVSAGVRYAMRLPGGDWFVGLDDARAARLSPEGEPRWSVPLQVEAAVEADGAVVVVGNTREATREQARDDWRRKTRSIFAIDDTGATRWTITPKILTDVPAVRAVRSSATTVVATIRGALSVDDTGAILWETPEPTAFDVYATAAGRDVVIASGDQTINAAEIDEGTTRKDPCRVRIFHPATGHARARAEIAPEGHRCAPTGIATLGDAIVLRIVDIHYATEGESQAQRTRGRFVILDATTLAIRASIPIPDAGGSNAGVSLPPVGTSLAPGELAFLESYATEDTALALTIVDTRHRKVRTAQLMMPRPVSVGAETMPSAIQLHSIIYERERILFSGQFVGHLDMVGGASIRSDVREVDRCIAAGHVACNEGNGTTAAAPFAGVFGALTFERSP